MTRSQYIAVRSRPRFVTRRQHSLAKQASWLKTEATAGSLLKAQNGYAPLTNCASYHFFTAADRILYNRHRAKGAYPCSRLGERERRFWHLGNLPLCRGVHAHDHSVLDRKKTRPEAFHSWFSGLV